MHISDDIECSCENPKKVIKRRVIVKLVQRQVMDNAQMLFTSFVENKVSELGIKSTISCKVVTAIRHWAENIRSWNYEAARRATIQVRTRYIIKTSSIERIIETY